MFIIRIILGLVFILFLPGFFLIEIIFPSTTLPQSHRIDWVERTTLAFSFSIATVPLLVYFLNRSGIAITTLNIFLEVLGLIVTAGIVIIVMRWRSKHHV